MNTNMNTNFDNTNNTQHKGLGTKIKEAVGLAPKHHHDNLQQQNMMPTTGLATGMNAPVMNTIMAGSAGVDVIRHDPIITTEAPVVIREAEQFGVAAPEFVAAPAERVQATTDYVRERDIVHEKPVITEKTVVHEKPLITEKPVIIEKDVIINKNVVHERDVVEKVQPVVHETHVTKEIPIVKEMPVVKERPLVQERHTVVEKPVNQVLDTTVNRVDVVERAPTLVEKTDVIVETAPTVVERVDAGLTETAVLDNSTQGTLLGGQTVADSGKKHHHGTGLKKMLGLGKNQA